MECALQRQLYGKYHAQTWFKFMQDIERATDNIFPIVNICTDGHNKTHVGNNDAPCVIDIWTNSNHFRQCYLPVAFLIDCDFIEAHQNVDFIIELQSTKQLESICFRIVIPFVYVWRLYKSFNVCTLDYFTHNSNAFETIDSINLACLNWISNSNICVGSILISQMLPLPSSFAPINFSYSENSILFVEFFSNNLASIHSAMFDKHLHSQNW